MWAGISPYSTTILSSGSCVILRSDAWPTSFAWGRSSPAAMATRLWVPVSRLRLPSEAVEQPSRHPAGCRNRTSSGHPSGSRPIARRVHRLRRRTPCSGGKSKCRESAAKGVGVPLQIGSKPTVATRLYGPSQKTIPGESKYRTSATLALTETPPVLSVKCSLRTTCPCFSRISSGFRTF